MPETAMLMLIDELCGSVTRLVEAAVAAEALLRSEDAANETERGAAAAPDSLPARSVP